MKNEKIIVMASGASGIVGYGILKCLNSDAYFRIGTTIYKESAAECFSDKVLNPPLSSDPDYVPWLLNTIDKYDIDVVFPGIELDMEVWNRNRNSLEDTGCKVVLNNHDLIELCLDKWEFYKKLEEAKLRCRIFTTDDLDGRLPDRPFAVKPRNGYGSRGFAIINSEEEYAEYRHENGDNFIIQELVGTPDEEYTIAVFYDIDSIPKASISLKRRLSKQGFTEIAEVVDLDDELAPILTELAELFHPIGPTDYQFRRTENGWKLLEINPRISSSTSIRALFGYNEPKMCIDYFIHGLDIEKPEIRSGKVIRYTEDFIIR